MRARDGDGNEDGIWSPMSVVLNKKQGISRRRNVSEAWGNSTNRFESGLCEVHVSAENKLETVLPSQT
jgi:hypothetical protein